MNRADGDALSILLVDMPVSSSDFPSLSLALLQGQLRRRGHHCRIRHFGLEYGRWVGDDLVQALTYYGYRTGEWLFVPALYGSALGPDDAEAFLPFIGDIRSALPPGEVATVLEELRDRSTDFVEWCADTTDWSSYDVVGFTSMFSQTIAGLALAQRIRHRQPDVGLIFGGANFHDEMGVALHESFTQIDMACLGEGDDVVVPAVEALASRQDPSAVDGIVYRSADGNSIVTRPAPMRRDLDDLPMPDYGDWLADRAQVGMGTRPRRLLIETSRGCWWGERSHCTFCGLNPTGMPYRAKSAERTLAEIMNLRDRYDVDVVQAIDNILSMRYFESLLPRLASIEPPLSFFYDTKATLTHRQVALLAAAGINEMLPGIESLSDAVLARMAKGTTALRNIQLLKWAAEFGIDVEWNLIHGFPGDREEDYSGMLGLIEACRHLRPPRKMQEILIDRFSPFHSTPETLGFTNLRAAPVYAHLFPFPAAQRNRIAYEFAADHLDDWVPCDAEAIIGGAVDEWMAEGAGGGGLWMHDGGDEILLVDERSRSRLSGPLRLSDWRADVYRTCDRVRTIDELLAGGGHDPVAVEGFVRWCQKRMLMVRDDDRVLAVAVHTPARPHSDAARRDVRSPPRRIPVRGVVEEPS